MYGNPIAPSFYSISPWGSSNTGPTGGLTHDIQGSSNTGPTGGLKHMTYRVAQTQDLQAAGGLKHVTYRVAQTRDLQGDFNM